MFQMQSNSSATRRYNVDVTVERDNGVFLSLVVNEAGDESEVLDLIATDPEEITQFFTDAERANGDWQHLTAGD